jgi:electron transfer flavoprotein beta subunit
VKKHAADKPLRVALMVRRLRGRPDGSAAEEVLGECERAALAAALTLRDELDAQVTAIAVGPGRREDRVLAMALRAGCDAAVRIHDTGLQGLDYLGIANILAAAANHLGFDLILCGDRSQDERQGAVGPAVAELLEIPHLSSAVTDLNVDENGLVATRRANGRIQTLRVAMPAVISVARFLRESKPVPADDASEAALDEKPTPSPRPPLGIIELDLGDLGLSARELRYRAQFLGRARPVRTPRQPLLLPTATDLVARLREDHLLG